MMKWLKELWEYISVWPGTEFTVWERRMILSALVLVVTIVFLNANAMAGSVGRRHLDSMPDIELCAYRSAMTEIAARYWNTGLRSHESIPIAWHGDETEFEKAAVVEYLRWAFHDFIPQYIADREKEGKPVSTLITQDVEDKAQAQCVYAIENSHFKKTKGKPMQDSNAVENFQRANDALYTAHGKWRGRTAENMVMDLNRSAEQYDIDPRRYAWILEYINSCYADKGDPWAWFVRQIAK